MMTNEEYTPLVICTIFRNESLYLDEWIQFHLLVGAERFYLYNNRSDDNYMDILSPYIDSGIVDLTDWPFESPCQLAAYQHLIDRAAKRKVWVAFLDIDEFLFSPQYDNVIDILNFQKSPIAFGVNWMCFGSGRQENYINRPVIERFYLRANDNLGINTHIKSIIRLDQKVRVGTDPHFFNVENGTYNEKGERIYGPFSDHTSRVLRINHYKNKSKEEFIKRLALGKPDLQRNLDVNHNMQYFNEIEGTEIDDRTIQRFLPELNKNLAKLNTSK